MIVSSYEHVKREVSFTWHEKDGVHHCYAEHIKALEGVGEAEIESTPLGWRARVTFPFEARYVAALTVEETKAQLEKAIVEQLVTCGRLGHFFSDYWGEYYRELWEATAVPTADFFSGLAAIVGEDFEGVDVDEFMRDVRG